MQKEMKETKRKISWRRLKVNKIVKNKNENMMEKIRVKKNKTKRDEEKQGNTIYKWNRVK